MISSGNPITRPSPVDRSCSLVCHYGKNIARRFCTARDVSADRGGLSLGLDLEDLTAAVHAGLQVDVVRTAQFARVLVLDIGGTLERVGRAAHATARGRGFSLRNGH